MVDRLHTAGWRVLLAMGVIYLVWGSTFLATRIATDVMPPLFMVAIRLLVAAVVLVGWALVTRAPRPTLREARHAAVVGLMLPTVGNGGVTLGVAHVPSGLVALLVASIPLWMALFAALGVGGPRVRPRRRVLLGLVAGFAGIVLLVASRPVRHDQATPGGAAVLWALVPVVSSMSWAWGSLWSRRVALPRSPLWSMGLGLLAGAPLLLAGSAASGELARVSAASFTPAAVASLLYLALFGTVLGLGAYLWLLARVSPTLVSTYAFVNPLVAMTLGGLLLGERLTGVLWAASALVVVAVATIVTAPPARPVATAAEPAADALSRAS